MINCDVRIATYTTNHGKNTCIRFYDGKDALIDASRVLPKICGDCLYFIPQPNGLALNNAQIQLTTKYYQGIHDGEYDLEYDKGANVYFVCFSKKRETVINAGLQTGNRRSSTASRTGETHRKPSKGDDTVIAEPVKEEKTDISEAINKPVTMPISNPGAEAIIRTFLEYGLDKAIEAGKMDEIKAFHLILKSIR